MMITGDLVKCNDTGSMGIITRVSDITLGVSSGITAVDYKVLWPEGSHTWENITSVTPIPEKDYAS
tara:strand:- start:1363 stop:1560 length:198 start_codon:yes stop_codon:yes gene_type:complete